MTTPLLIGLTLLLLVLTAFWAMARTRRIREAAQQREEEALARVRAGAPPLSLDGETVFEAAGLPSRLPERRGIEVAEHDEVVDLEALLAGEPQGVAHRARATLEEPTNISLDLDTLPPRPATPPAAAASVPAPGLTPTQPAAAPPAAPVLQSLSSMHPPSQAFATAMASQAAPARPAPSRAQPSPPTLVARLPGDAERRMAPPAIPPAAAAPRPVPSSAPLPAGGGSTIRRGNDDVPLRELTLAWFEARGYRSAPASSAVRPIEQVLRHRHDPARAYAFVVETARLTAERVQQLRSQARAIGLLRVLIVADAGAEEGAATKSKGVRVMDRVSLAAEFDQLDFSVAAKIIAVARKRSGGPITVH
ncbi:MAG: hypothetical protein U5L03_15425 [Burkholderiaceae bacterium]|nr:hypothetical protein [Burkholderiaceae bacterium]